MKETEHLKIELLEQFVGRNLEGCVSCPVERHLSDCPECLKKLERLLQGRGGHRGSGNDFARLKPRVEHHT
jgi:hypothetical protein